MKRTTSVLLIAFGLVVSPLAAQTPTDPCAIATQARFGGRVLVNEVREFNRDSITWLYVVSAESTRGRCILRQAAPPQIPPVVSGGPIIPPGQPPVTPPDTTTPPPSGYVTPDILTNASVESNWQGFTSSGFTAPANATRDGTRAYNGSMSIRRAIVNTTNSGDVGGSVDFPFYAGSPLSSYTPSPAVPAQTHDRLWTRFYFYIDAAFDGPFKFHQLYSSGFNTQFSGLYFFSGHLGVVFTPEAAGGGIVQLITPLSGLVGGWHSFEMDYWRNGDPSGWPSVAMWLDNVPVTQFTAAPTAPQQWVNGRLQLGQRTSTTPIGVAHWLGVLNGKNTGGLSNSVPGNVWVDRISISSRGRIGP